MFRSLVRKIRPEPEDLSLLNYLIIGLGNPGREYRNNRHNVGFMAIDRISQKYGISINRYQGKALVGNKLVEDRKIILAKPQTYLHLSGQAVSTLVKFYKVPFERMLVIYDEVDLPFGTIRIRPGGGSAGHKGLGSIIQQIGTEEFPRIRIGIGRPPGQKSAANYVLRDFSNQEKSILDEILDSASEAVAVFIQSSLDQAMNQYNGSIQKE
jgi:PTH1 family peptidyl-tRNA hydrolase